MSNLRTIGQGLAVYLAENKGTFPAAYMYAGKGQSSGLPTEGYIHWSSYLYGDRSKRGTTAAYQSTQGWDAFVCPSFGNGGLPPTNTYKANVGEGVDVDMPGVIDQQAPRLSYTVNEAIMPRNKFPGFDASTVRPYQLVKATQVKGAGRVILATEFSQDPSVVAAGGDVNSGVQVSKSHRPVSGFVCQSGTYDLYKIPPLTPGAYKPNLSLLPGLNPGVTENRLAWIGRNHGRARLNSFNQDVRLSNFLFVDGHVETKRLAQTLYPEFQWGDRWYSATDSSGFFNPKPSSSELDSLK
jgi:prepilin-type processing-associated H-X9-DG protein